MVSSRLVAVLAATISAQDLFSQPDNVTIEATQSQKGSSERFIVTNGCSTDDIWIASSDNVPGGPLVLLKPGQTYRYSIPDGLASTRFWPKMGCDPQGQRCKIGDSGGPGQTCNSFGCAPPVDSKFEATWGNPNSGRDCFADATSCDWWDTSGVDGFTLPFKISISESCKLGYYQGVDIDCSSLRVEECPAQSYVEGVGTRDFQLLHPETGEVVGCYSPCSLLTSSHWWNPDGRFYPTDSTAGPYCCPTPPFSAEQCRAGPADSSEYTKLIHAHCPVYAYAYDDAIGLQVCPPDTVYHWTLGCPYGPPPTPQCAVGDLVPCSEAWSENMCSGNQCCSDLSTCPSADASFTGCPNPKNYDCTTGPLFA